MPQTNENISGTTTQKTQPQIYIGVFVNMLSTGFMSVFEGVSRKTICSGVLPDVQSGYLECIVTRQTSVSIKGLRGISWMITDHDPRIAEESALYEPQPLL